MLDHDGRIEPSGHGGAGVGELPVASALPCGRIGQRATCSRRFKGIETHSDGIHGAREARGERRPSAHVSCEHASARLGNGNALDRTPFGHLPCAPAKTTRQLVHGDEHLAHGLLAGELDVVRMVPHGWIPLSRKRPGPPAGSQGEPGLARHIERLVTSCCRQRWSWWHPSGYSRRHAWRAWYCTNPCRSSSACPAC